MAHAPWCRAPVLLQCRHTLRPGSVQPGRGAENASMTLPGVFDHIHQKRTVPTMSGHDVEAVKAPLDQRIYHSQPEILKDSAASVEGTGKRGAMCAHPYGNTGRQMA